MSRLLSQPSPANAIALYAFLLHTANRQGTQNAYATEFFISRGLRWSRAKVGYVKKQLISLKLVESFARRDAQGRVKKHYLRVRFSARCPDAKNPDAKFTGSGEISGNAIDKTSNAYSENSNAFETKSKGDTTGSAAGGGGSFSNSPAASSTAGKSFSAVWKPDSRSRMEKLAALAPPRHFPSELEFDDFLARGELYCVAADRPDLYQGLCVHKWCHFDARLGKWRRIRSWKKYVAALENKILAASNPEYA